MKFEDIINACEKQEKKLKYMKNDLLLQMYCEVRNETVRTYFDMLRYLSNDIPAIYLDLQQISYKNIHTLTIGDKFPAASTEYTTCVHPTQRKLPSYIKGASYLTLNFILDENNIITDVKFEHTPY